MDGNEVLKITIEFLALAITIGGGLLAWLRGAIKTARELAERTALEARDEVRAVEVRVRATEITLASRETEWRGLGERLDSLRGEIAGLRADIKSLSSAMRSEAEREVDEHERRCRGFGDAGEAS